MDIQFVSSLFTFVDIVTTDHVCKCPITLGAYHWDNSLGLLLHVSKATSSQNIFIVILLLLLSSLLLIIDKNLCSLDFLKLVSNHSRPDLLASVSLKC